MLPFFVLLLVPLCIQHVKVGEKNINYEKRNKTALFFFFAWLTVLIALRHESIGNDTNNYMNYFVQFSKTSWQEVGQGDLEIGFLYFNKIVSLFSNNPRFFLVCAAVIVSAMIYPTYIRLCTDSSLTIALFCLMSTFVMMFSGIRQMLAIGIGFIAYEFTRNKKPIHFFVSVIIATTIHSSAFMLIFMYPVYNLKITKKRLIAIVPVLIGIFVFNKQIFSQLTFLLSRFTRFDSQMTSTGAFTMLLLFAIFAIFAFVVPDEEKLDQETIGLRNLLLLSLVIQMLAPLHMLAMRMNYYYIIFIPLLLPKIIASRSDRWGQVAVGGRHIMVLFFLTYFFFSAYTKTNNLNVFPYHFFWEAV